MARTLNVRASIFNFPRKLAVAETAEDLKAATSEIGAQGILYSWLRHLHGQKVPRQLVADGIIDRFQQSFVGKNFLSRGVLHAPMELIYLAFMGSLEKSLGRLVPLQEISEETHNVRRPVIIHTSEQRGATRCDRIDYRTVKRSGNHGPLLHQPTIEELLRARLYSANPDQTARRMLDWQAKSGLDHAVALDLGHLLAERMTDVGPRRLPLEWSMGFAGTLAAERALADPGEIQLSHQSRLGGDIKSLADILGGGLAETPYGKVIGAIAQSLPDDQPYVNVTTEVLPREFDNGIIDIGWVEGNKRLVQAIGTSSLAATA